MYFYIFKDVIGEWRWRFYADNYKIIASSGEGYRNESDVLYAINLIKQNSSIAQILK
ncbi:MAG: DUF1508 domain-containing protein [Candidatus Paceibacterota bacterium]|jgi:uncharacterized protein YegP (UPF0339 family)